MNSRNVSKPRCIIVAKDLSLRYTLNALLPELGYNVDIATSRIDAMRLFMTHRHSLFLIEADLLPRYPHRLIQFFKMAHRTPGVLIFSNGTREVTAYSYIDDGIYEIVDIPYKIEDLIITIKRTADYMKMKSKNLFLRDLLLHAGLAMPVLFLLAHYLSR
ncbi:hypothetical protein CHISP_1054 [Chitinispirillum alkaliphilum]|nr:hypothetical protein CHISP_1054 [Chitinispirillum alkaliphilum]